MSDWLWVFGLNRNNKYYVRKGVKGHQDLSRKDISVMAWFTALKDSVDKMPDSNKWQLTAPFRKVVWKW